MWTFRTVRWLEHWLAAASLLLAVVAFSVRLDNGELAHALLAVIRIAAAFGLWQRSARKSASQTSCLDVRWALPLLALSLCIRPARAELITIGTIATVISTIIDVISAAVTLSLYLLLVLQYSFTWSIAVVIVVYVYINVFDAFGALTHYNFIKAFSNMLLAGAQCEPFQPEYGYERPDRYTHNTNALGT